MIPALQCKWISPVYVKYFDVKSQLKQIVNEQKNAVNDQKYAVADQKNAVTDQKNAVANQKNKLQMSIFHKTGNTNTKILNTIRDAEKR